jgi:hypothetical protein
MKKRHFQILLILLPILIVGRAVLSNNSRWAELNNQRLIWRETGSENYFIVVQHSGFPAHILARLTVEQNSVTRIEYLNAAGYREGDPQDYLGFLTIEHIFEEIERCYRGFPMSSCKVKYDISGGYPIEANLDPGGISTMDDQLYYQIIYYLSEAEDSH